MVYFYEVTEQLKTLFLLIVYTWWPLTVVTFTFSVIIGLNYIDLNDRSTISIWRSQSNEHDPICKLHTAILCMVRFLKTESATACQTFFQEKYGSLNAKISNLKQGFWLTILMPWKTIPLYIFKKGATLRQ